LSNQQNWPENCRRPRSSRRKWRHGVLKAALHQFAVGQLPAATRRAARGDIAAAHFSPIWVEDGVSREEATMTYRVYSGPRGSQSISPLEKDRHLYKEFSILDEAMSWARHINDSGRVALLIEGDDGTRLTKQQIVTALKSLETNGSQGHAA
jgi:hypothetical protein